MKRLITDRTAISLVFFVVMAYAVYSAQDFDFAARLMPMIVGIPTLVLSALVLALEIAFQWLGKTDKGGSAMDGSRVSKDLSPEQRSAMVRREVSVVLWFIGLILIIWVFGLLWALPIFLVLFLWLQARESWRLTLSIAFGTWAVVYVLFVQILNMELYHGLIQQLWSN